MTASLWLLLALALPQASSSAPRYRLIELAAPGAHSAIAYDVNERRAVVGAHDPGEDAPLGSHAVRWDVDGSMTDLTPGTNYWFGRANSINNDGVVVGKVATRDAAPEGGFRWKDGVLEFLPSRFQMDARHVDERGYVAGYAHSPVFLFEPTIWAPDLSYVQPPGLGGGGASAEDLNGWGDIVGYDMLTPTGQSWHAFAIRAGITHDLGTLPGHANSFAFAINVAHVTVGASGPVLGERAVRWLADGTIEPLASLGTGGSVAFDINDHGEIVGHGTGPQGSFAMLWIDGVAYSLEDLVPDLNRRRLLGAESINERGDIAGFLSPANGGFARAFLAVRTDGGHPAVIGPSPARAGATSTIEVVGATPGSVVALHLGLRPGKAGVRGCLATTIEIQNPRVLHGIADSAGTVRFDVSIPALLRGKHVLAQAVELGRCRKTSLSVTRLD